MRTELKTRFIIAPWFQESRCACMDQSKRARWIITYPCVNNKEEGIFRFKSVATLWLFKQLWGSKEYRIAHKWCESCAKRCNVNSTGYTVWSPSTAPKVLKPRCALHRWGGVEMRSLISYFATCNVNLCIDRYKMFHQNANITQSKKSLVNQFNK